jgi:hypothetical protein
MLPIQKKTKLAWMARLHFWVTFFSFFLYLGLGFTLGPDFFYSDIKQKLFAFGDDTIAITAVVPPPPSSPVVTATPSCVAGAPRIALDWANDPGADFWDIDRDSAPLTTGVTVSQYVDTAVVPNGTYTYVVTAYGSMGPGSAVSNPVVVTALDCPNLLPPATVRIETLGDKNVSEARQNVDLSRRRPKVTGTTNVANAIIDIVVTNPTIRARTTANTNGYFEWIPPMKLDTGNHLLEVKATDPNDATRTATDSFVFWTKNVSAGTTDGKR